MENIEKLDWSWKTIRTTQEHLNYFDTSFTDDPTDIFVCHINEIEPILRKTTNLTETCTSDIEEDSNLIVDPRNSKVITNLILDYSQNARVSNKKQLNDTFTSPSRLTKSEHGTCLKVLKYQKLKLDIPANDQEIFDESVEIRSEEHKSYNEFFYQHTKLNPIQNILSDIYINYLNLASELLLKSTNQIYSLETGIRLPSNVGTNIQGLSEGSLNNSKIILNQGYIAEFNETFDLTKLRYNLTKFINHLPQPNSAKIEHDETNNYDIIITDQSLKLLLEPVIDNNEWEIPLKIFENSDGKIGLTLENPLPLRSINYKTNTYLFKELFKISLNFCNDVNWYKMEKDKMHHFNTNLNEEIYAKNLDINYKLKSLKKYENVINSIDFKSNEVFVECDLCSEKKENFRMLIKSSAQFCDKDGSYINFSPKLEYYSQFGNTNMTAEELLDEWIQQKLFPNSILKRCRIDANTFEILQIEEVSIEEIENSLNTVHQINISALLSSFHDFFNALMSSFPYGDYILKYSATHKEKLIIYREKQPRSENVIDLHGIYGNVVKNSQFIQNFESISIDHNSYNVMHEINQIYPCCFPYNSNKNTRQVSNRNERNKNKINYNETETKKTSVVNTRNRNNNRNNRNNKNNNRNRSQQPKKESINKIDLPIKRNRIRTRRSRKNNKNELKKIAANDIVKTNEFKKYQTRYQKNKNSAENKEQVENFNVDQYLSNFTNNTLTRDEIMEDKMLKKKKIELK